MATPAILNTEVVVPSIDGDAGTAAAAAAGKTPDGSGADGEIEPAHREGEDPPKKPADITLADMESIKVEGDDYDPGQPNYTGDAKFDALIDHFAARTRLSPKRPEDFKTLQTLVHKQLYIQKLQDENKVLKTPGAAAQQQQQGPLTEFEKTLLEGVSGKPAAATPGAEPARTATGAPAKPSGDQPYPYNDAGKAWRNAADAYVDLGKAWGTASELAEKGDPAGFQRIAEVEAAIFQRRFDDIAIPALAEMLPGVIEQIIQQRIGDVLPSARRSADREELAVARDFAIGELAKTPGYEQIQELIAEDDGEPVVFDGEQFPSTPLNRIMAENPWILKIQESHKDTDTARRLTFLQRYRAAHAIFTRGQVDASKAKSLMKAGEKLANRKKAEQVRQALNAGKGAGLSSGQSDSGSYVAELVSAGTGERSFGSL